jgi:hypothetical protein
MSFSTHIQMQNFSAKRKPWWQLDGEWTADERNLFENLFNQYRHRYDGIGPRWLLFCRRYRDEIDYHASYGSETILYAPNALELAQRIEWFLMTGKTDTPFTPFEIKIGAEIGQEEDTIKQLKQDEKAKR